MFYERFKIISTWTALVNQLEHLVPVLRSCFSSLKTFLFYWMEGSAQVRGRVPSRPLNWHLLLIRDVFWV